MAFAAGAQKLGRVLLDLFYPPRCVGCGRTETLYCAACRDSVSPIASPFCPLCGQPQGVPGLCIQCISQPPDIDGIRSVAVFEGTLCAAIHGFKYKYMRTLSVPLGEMLVGYWRENPLSIDVIVPVPLHRRRTRERGYNQSELLAEHLACAVNVPIACDALHRDRYTLSQTHLGEQERRRNVAGAFSSSDASFQGKRVLLVDDVCTTGSTLKACSQALKAGGARTVWALSLARAKYT